jgi:hypothetical protein
MSDRDDLLLHAVAAAPEGPPLTAEERAAVEESERHFAAGGQGKSQEEIEAMLAAMRPQGSNFRGL